MTILDQFDFLDEFGIRKHAVTTVEYLSWGMSSEYFRDIRIEKQI